MRQFSFLVIIALAFGAAAVFYEKESRKVKGVLSQITDLQAKVGDMQAEINRLNSELETMKLAERRRPNLNSLANRVLNPETTRAEKTSPVIDSARSSGARGSSSGLAASDVTSSVPAIRGRGENPEDSEWSKPTVDAEVYEAQTGKERPVTDPYQ